MTREPSHDTAATATGDGGGARDRPVGAGVGDRRGGAVLLVASYVALAVLGVLLALWGAFLVPLRLAGVEGLSVVIAVVGNLAVGLLGAVGTGSRLGALLPGAAWLVVAMALAASRPEGDLVIPGQLSTDPGVAVVGTLFLFLGAIAAAAAVGLGPGWSRRFTARGALPRQRA